LDELRNTKIQNYTSTSRHFVTIQRFSVSPYSSVSKVTGYRLDGRVSISGKSRDSVFVSTTCLALGTTYPMGTSAFSPGI